MKKRHLGIQSSSGRRRCVSASCRLHSALSITFQPDCQPAIGTTEEVVRAGWNAYLTLHARIKYEVLYQCNLKPITKLQLHIHLHRFTTTIIISLSIYPTTGGSCERFSVHTRARHLMIVPSWLQQRTCIPRTYCYKYTLIIRCEWNQNDQY